MYFVSHYEGVRPGVLAFRNDGDGILDLILYGGVTTIPSEDMTFNILDTNTGFSTVVNYIGLLDYFDINNVIYTMNNFWNYAINRGIVLTPDIMWVALQQFMSIGCNMSLACTDEFWYNILNY